jgi:hypothetical protein
MVSIPLLAASSLILSNTNQLYQKHYTQSSSTPRNNLQQINKHEQNPLQFISHLREMGQITLHHFVKKCMAFGLSNNADSILNDKFNQLPEFLKPYRIK